MFMSEEILKQVQNVLVPKVGAVVADSSIRVNCQRMGIDPKDLTPEKLSAFSESLKISLLLFLNEAETEDVYQKIKQIQQK